MRADHLDALSKQHPHHPDTVKAVQSHCAYATPYARADWLARVDVVPAPVLCAATRVLSTESVTNGTISDVTTRTLDTDGNNSTKNAELAVSGTITNYEKCKLTVESGTSVHFINVKHCTIVVKCLLQQVRLTRVTDCVILFSDCGGGAKVVALESSNDITFLARNELRVRDFTPNRLVPNYTIKSDL